jgi:hypothetical protein
MNVIEITRLTQLPKCPLKASVGRPPAGAQTVYKFTGQAKKITMYFCVAQNR